MGDAKIHPEDSTKTNGFSIVELEKDTVSISSLIEQEIGSAIKSNTDVSNPDDDDEESHECDETCKKKFPLHWAAKESDAETFKNLLKSTHEDLSALDCHNSTLLIVIAGKEETEWQEAKEEMIELFMKLVTAQGKLDSVDKISEFVNARKIKGERKTALHYAAEMYNKSLVEMLLSYGADSSIQDSYGSVPLHYSVQGDSKDAYDCAELLLDSMTDKNILNTLERSALEEAVLLGIYEDMVKLLVDKGCSPRPIHIDKETGKETRVLILHTGVHYVYDEDETNIACLKVFLASLTAEDINAKYTGDGEPIWKGRTALHVAAYNLFPNVLRCLLDNEHTDVFAVDDDGRSALHIIADFGYNTKTGEFVDILLGGKRLKKKDKEKLFNMTDAAGETPLDITIRRDSYALSKAILLQNPNYPDEWMTRDLFEKIYYKVPEIMLPVMDQYINFDNKNYEANDEVFEANIGGITFFENNPYEDGYPEKIAHETDFLAIMLDSPFVKWDEMEAVINHPTVQLFIFEKWRKLRLLFWLGMGCKILWLIFYLSFVISVFWVSFPYPEAKPMNETTNNNQSSSESGGKGKYLQSWQSAMGITIVAATILIFYMKSILSIISVGFRKTLTPILIAHLFFSFSVCFTIITVYIWGVQDWHYVVTAHCNINVCKIDLRNYSVSDKLNIFDLLGSIILVSFIGMWECRDVPVIGIYADVFFTAIKNLMRLMIAFTPLLVGFSIAISLMLNGDKNFADLHWNFIKILVMMLGEINFSDIVNSSDYHGPFRPFAILVIALFVISVPIVMFNLLLGFTISDVQALEADSEMKILISTLEQIILLERLVLSLPAQKLLPKAVLWRFLVERKEWTPECERFGRKCALRLLMGDIPRRIRIKIREIARTRPVKKANNVTQ